MATILRKIDFLASFMVIYGAQVDSGFKVEREFPDTSEFRSWAEEKINMKKFVMVILLVTFLAPLGIAEELSPVAATHYMEARVALIDNDFNKALEEINAAIELAPQHFLSYFFRGFVYIARKEYNRAEAEFPR